MTFDGILSISLWGWGGWKRIMGKGLSWTHGCEVVCYDNSPELAGTLAVF